MEGLEWSNMGYHVPAMKQSSSGTYNPLIAPISLPFSIKEKLTPRRVILFSFWRQNLQSSFNSLFLILFQFYQNQLNTDEKNHLSQTMIMNLRVKGYTTLNISLVQGYNTAKEMSVLH